MKKLKNASLFIITLLLFVILAPSASAFANSPASCDGYGSEQCRSTKMVIYYLQRALLVN